MTLFEEFSKQLEGKDLNQLIHQAKAESESRLLGQGIAYLALLLADIMADAILTPDQGELRRLFTRLKETAATSPRG